MEQPTLPGLQLKKTKLYFSEGSLRHGDRGEDADASFALADIKEVRVEKKPQLLLPCLFLLLSVGLGAISWTYIPYAGWSWLAVLLCACCALFALATFNMEIVVIETEDGTVDYPINDPWEEANGFAVSINRMLRRSGDSVSS